MAEQGDSGAAVVDEQGNTVAGLFFVFNSTHSIASPIGVLLGPLWKKVGEHDTGTGAIPMFQGPLP